jgi:hypothetical protein
MRLNSWVSHAPATSDWSSAPAIMNSREDSARDSGTTTAARSVMADQDKKSGPLDGSTSGTIGGGGRETGGPTDRPAPAENPPADPENVASGRLAPEPIDATVQRDELKRGPRVPLPGPCAMRPSLGQLA